MHTLKGVPDQWHLEFLHSPRDKETEGAISSINSSHLPLNDASTSISR